jgi:hypothetical protein
MLSLRVLIKNCSSLMAICNAKQKIFVAYTKKKSHLISDEELIQKI